MAPASPFHRGEQELQTRLGIREWIEEAGRRSIRDHLLDAHREFYAELPFLIVGSMDQAGRPWASLLAGRPGFIAAPDATTLTIAAQPTFGDPLRGALVEGARLGFLGIDYRSRRLHRLSGRLTSFDERGMEIHVDQTFGGGQKFIQARAPELDERLDAAVAPRPVHQLERLDQRARAIISAADHFFIATHYSEDDGDVAQGTDVSHRGGRPGFVRIEDDSTLIFPDFDGNHHFHTLGNILLNPRAGLLFIDFASGDLLYLTCSARVIWEGWELDAFAGAERLVRLALERARLVEGVLPLEFSFIDLSPFLEQTGSWGAVEARHAARGPRDGYREYRVTRVEPESDTITSFYLEPADGQAIARHRAGQFLPIEVRLPGAARPVQRTYTISNAPNGSYYRLSIKREDPGAAGGRRGSVSSFFHDHVGPGATIRALGPRGCFTLDATGTRPVVLISAGVGITPMMSMLEQLDRERRASGRTRRVWFVHGARNSAEQAFGALVRDTARTWSELTTHFRFSRPGESDVEGRDYDSVGRIDATLLESLLPPEDCEFYVCGPGPFIESVHVDLQQLGVAHERIHYEYFRPGKTLSASRPGESAAVPLEDRAPVRVEFARSGVEATWQPAKGTLLDLAESEGLEPAYRCRAGVCRTCATSLRAGSVEYVQPPAAPLPERIVLICSAYPAAASDGAEPDPVVLDL